MVLRTDQGFFAIGTDSPQRVAMAANSREFPVLHSRDLQKWQFLGGALSLPAGLEALSYWAPEVAQKDGEYFLYYSAGAVEGQGHKIRVATSNRPAGPYEGEDKPLIRDEPFSIDAHPFLDPVSGKWFLFFAKDFFDEPYGTGIAIAQLGDDMMSVEGPVPPLLRGGEDWQVYERDRFWYDRIWPVWYCLEGPFVIYRQNRYWMFYSGGNWHAEHYGVGCAVADQVAGPYHDARAKDGPSILRTGGGLFGPGHCSVVGGLDGEDYICFHAWDESYTARQMHIARLNWTADGPNVLIDIQRSGNNNR